MGREVFGVEAGAMATRDGVVCEKLTSRASIRIEPENASGLAPSLARSRARGDALGDGSSEGTGGGGAKLRGVSGERRGRKETDAKHCVLAGRLHFEVRK